MVLDFQDFLPQGNFISLIHRQIRESSLAHALLIAGEEGTGKKSLADIIAKALLCQDSGHQPCGKCASCRQASAGEHPDLIVIRKGFPISSESGKKNIIPVADITELESRCAVHPFEGERRVVIIQDADNMNPAAQNKLLKTLEEPPDGTFFLLTTAKKDSLLPTIISRCQSVYLHPWSMEYVLSVLRKHNVPEQKAVAAAEECSGSVGLALQLSDNETYWNTRNEIFRSFFHCKNRSDIPRISGQWKDRRDDASLLFSVLESGILRLVDYKTRRISERSREDLKDLFDPSWLQFAENSDLYAFTKLLDGITLARKRFLSSVNFQVIVEQILFMLMEANKQWSA